MMLLHDAAAIANALLEVRSSRTGGQTLLDDIMMLSLFSSLQSKASCTLYELDTRTPVSFGCNSTSTRVRETAANL